MQAKTAISLVDAFITMEPPEDAKTASKKSDADARFGLRVLPAAGGRTYVFRASSEEERRVWYEAMDRAANKVAAFSIAGMGRTVKLQCPANQPVGIDLRSEPNSPCVTICSVGENGVASGLLVGDVVVAVDETVLRTMDIAQRTFARARAHGAEVTLRLAAHNREVRVDKLGGVSGLTLCASDTDVCPDGSGVVVLAVTPHSAAHKAGLHAGDRILAINGTRVLAGDHVHATEAIRSAMQVVRLVVMGETLAVQMMKDADGRLGLGFTQCTAPYGTQGAVITDVTPRSAADAAGLRPGDLLISVEGHIVVDQRSAMDRFAAAKRALTCAVWRPCALKKDKAERSEADLEEAQRAQYEKRAFVGAAPLAYFTSNLMERAAGGHPPLMGVQVWEDLTVASGSSSKQATGTAHNPAALSSSMSAVAIS